MANLPTWIEGLRNSLGLDQTAFGKLLGVRQPTVSRWEDQVKPSKPAFDVLDAMEDLARRNGYPTYRQPLFNKDLAESAVGFEEIPRAKQRMILATLRAQIKAAIDDKAED